MQIVDINEPAHEVSSHKADNVAVGIDFGTTNSLIAIARDQSVTVIPSFTGHALLPSIITLETTPQIVIRSIKRLLGKATPELLNTPFLPDTLKEAVDKNSPTPKLLINNSSLTLPELAAKIFTSLKLQAEKHLGRAVKKAVVTVPAYFDDTAKGQVLFAAKIAGFEVMRLLAEPTAAAYAYGLNYNSSGCYLVYDLGGGTFDVSILYMQRGVLQVVALGGDNALGGDDIDHLLAEHFAQELNTQISQELILTCKRLKEKISHSRHCEPLPATREPQAKLSSIIYSLDSHVAYAPRDDKLALTQDKFCELITPLINKTIKIAKEVWRSAEEPALDGIILVGGSTRLPLITAKLSDAFKVPVMSDFDPDKAVVMGAALQAENLVAPQSKALLIDATPLSLGIELYGGIVEKIIPRNTALPIAVTKEFTTYADNQTGIWLHVVQGEREMAQDCRSLARFELKNLPAMKAGAVRVSVTFAIDAGGLLSVSAVDKTTGNMHIVEVKPSYGLSSKDIDDILKNAYSNAASDHHARLLQETKVMAESLLYNLQQAILETPDILPDKKMSALNNAIHNLQEVINSSDRNTIMQQMHNLEKMAEELVAARLNKTVATRLEGKHIDTL